MNAPATVLPTSTDRRQEQTQPWDHWRAHFPALHQKVHNKPLVYLDSAATALKPQCVIDAIQQVYAQDCSNVHRGAHTLSQRATAAYEQARVDIQHFINAAQQEEVVFTRGTTESINLVAQSFLRPRLQAGDEILVTALEHHANIVPWQLLSESCGAKLVVLPISDSGQVCDEVLEKHISPRTRLLAISHISNVLGTITPVQAMVRVAHAHGVPVLVDGAQAVPHIPVDVQALGCDFYAFSGHKMYGPTGIGVLYGKRHHLAAMPPYQGGGDMIRSVSFAGTQYAEPPLRFEAGTPNIAGAVGLGAAVRFLGKVGMEAIRAHEQELVTYASQALEQVPGLRLLGTALPKIGVFSFVIDGLHASDLGTLVDLEGVAIRVGHHCAEPLMHRFEVNATARASFGLYTQPQDIDALIAAIHQARHLLS